MDKLIWLLNKYLRLAFPNYILENKFQKHQRNEALAQNVLVAKFTIILYLSYAPITYLLLTRNEPALLILVSLLGISGALSLIIFSKTEKFQQHMLSSLLLTGFIVIISPYIYYIFTANTKALFQVDILLPVIGIFTMYGISFSLAFVTFILSLVAFIFLSLITGLDAFDFFAAMYVLISGGVVAGVAAYFMEKAHRRYFLAKQESDEFKYLVENAQDSIAVFDLKETRYLYANISARSCNGSVDNPLLGQRLMDTHPEFTPEVMDKIKKHLDEEGSFSDVYKIYSATHKDYYYAHVVIQYGYFEGQRVLITFSSDATQQKEAEIKLSEMAVKDSLTGLYNRYKFDDSARKQIALSKRHKYPLSLILCDIDHFKKVNDLHGHLVGDSILKEVSLFIKEMVRESDTVARWGGEEFAILLPNTTLNNAKQVAEKIRKHIEKESCKSICKISISCGVSELLKEDTQISWFKRADEALYEAKESGRNRVCFK